ncbi:unnamed protein product [Hymenolepis diminuta]|uniref:Uncharacterized protein n=1 Tax=Hymenolepis diminuta TaxID=6216 RepID=A0A0R3SYE6_HYMDI|nr:unnamed protein product [Hymenolepis diminuta]
MALVDYGDSDLSDSASDAEVVQECNPKPQPSKTLSDFQDKVEDVYKMRMPKNAKPFLQPLNIQHKVGVNGKVILSIPMVEDLNSSDDSDDDRPKRIQPQSTTSKSKSSKSLLDLLPPTRSLIVREGDKPVISQPLVPRQVARNPPPTKTPSSKPAEAVAEFEEENLDDDLSSTNSFFTFGAAKKPLASTLSAEEVRRKAREAILASEATATQRLSSTSSTGCYLPSLKEKPFSERELQKGLLNQQQQGDSYQEFEHENEEEPMFTAETFIPGPEVS